MLNRLCLAVGLTLAIATAAAAQGNPTGAISGHIVDETGLAVPGVTVTAASPVLQGLRTAVTSANGDYIIPFLPPGDYDGHVRVVGVSPGKQTVGVTMAETHAIDVKLAVAALAETVTVTRDGDDIAQTATIAAQFTRRRCSSSCRSAARYDAVLLAPGVNRNGPEQQHHDGRRAVLREPVPGQRRGREREPARAGAQPVHRGRDPGNEGLDGQHLRRVRPVQRRRGEHGHEVGRQHVQRIVPHDVQQRRVAGAHAVPNDQNVERGHADVRGHLSAARSCSDKLWFFGAGRLPSNRDRTGR